MAESLPHALFVGVAGAGKRSVADAIAGSNEATSWTIDNKYYRAEVALTRCTLPHALPLDCSAEALVLVIDATQQQSFEAARAWGSAADLESAEVRLLVATKVDLLLPSPPSTADGPVEAPRPIWLAAAIEWACEHQFEYIEVCTSDAALDARLQLDGEEQGIARVAAALSAHTWSNLTPKPQPRRGAAAAAAAAASAAASSGAGSEDESAAYMPLDREPAGSPPVSPTRAAAPPAAVSHGADASTATASAPAVPAAEAPAPSTSASAPAAGSAAAVVLSNGGSASESKASPAGAHSRPAVPPPASSADAALTEELEGQHCGVDEFDKLMADINGARDRRGTVPDDERRRTAAALAMRLASMMGQDSDESGADSSEDSG